MLEYFRNAAKSWVAKILLGLLALSFAAWGINDVFFSGFYSQNLATVGNQVISGPQYTQAINNALDRFSQGGNRMSLEEARQLGIDKQVRDSLINLAAVDSMAGDLGITYGDQAIINEATTNPMFQDATGKFSVTVFNGVLASNGFNEKSYIANERMNKMRLALTSAADMDVVPAALLEAQSQYRNETRKARYVTFSVSDADVAAPTDEELAKHYEANKGNYIDPEFRSVAIMKVEPQDIASKLQISDEEIKAGYEKYKTDYYSPERRTILQISFPDEAAAKKAKDRISAGEDFLAVGLSTGAKETDINLGSKLKSDLFDPAIAEAAFKLSKDGVSDTIKGGLATVLLKVTEIAPEKQSTLEEVKSELTSRLQVEKAREEVQIVFDAVEDARAAQTKFEDIASKAGIPFTLIPAVSATGNDRKGQPVQLPPSGEELLKAVFSSDVGVDNDSISLPDGFVWYDVREITPSAPQKLEDIKELVRADVKAVKLRTAAEDKAKRLLERVKANTTLDDLAKELKTTVKETAPIKRNEASAEFDMQSLNVLFAQPDKGKTYALEGDGVSAKLIEVASVSVQQAAPTEEEIKQNIESARSGIAGDMTQAFLAAVRAATPTTINEELWQRVDASPTAQQ
jgi:peptidyl-prolyl cis-trans isomerase D